ncbi:hypothetical protein QTH87_05920 [Variovorax sp. J22P168]|uniref:hypothetical protein n=1 Tax=Variovorax jilinensis TaxID=3053513 RepID=UPI002574F471|nr:hypothetical protein [Variovorax sp. J22P168]MDM0011975.1 hypothetical protein [Variovorax sp. J22P168]
MRVTFDTAALKALSAQLRRDVIPRATARGLNNVAFDARKAVQQEMRDVFDRPTPFITNSPFVTQATPDRLASKVSMRYPGGKGVEPESVLRAEITGGPRRLKRFEILLDRAGILPKGYFAVPGGKAPLDAYGNIRAAFIVKLISYLQAFGEQGYRANMTDKRRASMSKAGKTDRGYRTIGGVQYFATHGRLRGGHRGSHLEPGIWSRSGLHGMKLEPVILFVRQPTYAKRLDIEAVAQRVVDAQGARQMARALEFELRKLGGAAR